MLSLADALPVYHYNEAQIRVSATPARALAAAREARLEDVPLVALLFKLRGLRAAQRGPVWDALLAHGFQSLGDDMLVLVGKPWSPRGSLRKVDDFVAFAEPGYAKMAMDLRAVPDGDGARLETETRIYLTDAFARRRFGAYLLVIRPFSGLVRRSWLKAAKRRAEGGRPAPIPGSQPFFLRMAPRRASEVRKEADLDFERLYAGHRGDVFRAALRELGNVHDAEDVTQAAFIDAYRAVLRGSRPEAPRAWLLAIAENVRRRRFRAALRRPREAPLDPEAALAAEPTTEQTNALRIALTALPPQQRVVFLLREIVGLSYDEIAEELGSTVGAVQMLLFRARKACGRSSSHLPSPSAAASSCRSRAGSPASPREATRSF